jgi:hypothetical protein
VLAGRSHGLAKGMLQRAQEGRHKRIDVHVAVEAKSPKRGEPVPSRLHAPLLGSSRRCGFGLSSALPRPPTSRAEDGAGTSVSRA